MSATNDKPLSTAQAPRISTAASTDGSDGALRRGWTTGSCATAAAKSAVAALCHGAFLDPVSITLPKGQQVAFALSREERGEGWAQASVIKDAGDDPDVTHGATISVRVTPRNDQQIRFLAGPGVGTVTKPGLPIEVGEASITPVPRQMMTQAIRGVDPNGGYDVRVSIPGGEHMAKETLNARLGIIGGLSILGTTGIVVPYSCASWIHSIHRGIDVARALGLTHVIASTGATSEKLAQAHFGASEQALLDMGDFAGGLLKYLRDHPVPRLSIAGGIGKMAKLAAGEMDLHSSRSQVDLAFLADLDPATPLGGSATAAQALAANPALGDLVAQRSAQAAQAIVGDHVRVDTLITTRQGQIVGRFQP